MWLAREGRGVGNAITDNAERTKGRNEKNRANQESGRISIDFDTRVICEGSSNRGILTIRVSNNELRSSIPP